MDSLSNKATIYLLIAIGMAVTSAFLLLLRFSSVSAAGVFLLWLLSPYFILLFINARSCKSTISTHACIFMTITCMLTGIGALLDIKYIHPDPQGAIAILLIPPVQFLEIGVLSAFFGRSR